MKIRNQHFAIAIEEFSNHPLIDKGNSDTSCTSLEGAGIIQYDGTKSKNCYRGFIEKGIQTFELSLPAQQVNNLFYVLRIGDRYRPKSFCKSINH